MRSDAPVIVIGAGPAGLATSAMLKERGVRSLILDRALVIGSSWRSRYDSLSLNTSRFLSRLPGLRSPRGPGHWMARDEYVAYLERYVHRFDPHLLLETEVTRIDRADGAWRVTTSRGPMEAGTVVVATGQNHDPFVPPWPGRETFSRGLIHSSQYRNADRYRGRSVLVVGTGDSAADIALDSSRAGASRVWMSVRTPPFIVLAPRRGVPPEWLAIVTERFPTRVGDRLAATMRRLTIGDLTRYGLASPERGLFTVFREMGFAPIIDRRGFAKAVKRRSFEFVPAVDSLDRDHVVLADGSRIAPDVVFAATGYRRGLDDLAGHLGVLTDEGYPAATAPQNHPTAPDLFFVGFTNPFTGHLRAIRNEARKVARVIARRRNEGSDQATEA